MKFFGVDPEKQATTDSAGRLQRPWTVFVFGILLSVGAAAALFVRANGRADWNDKTTIGLVVFALASVALSGLYALIGSRYSKKLAQRVVGFTGLAIILGGLAYLAYMLLVLAP